MTFVLNAQTSLARDKMSGLENCSNARLNYSAKAKFPTATNHIENIFYYSTIYENGNPPEKLPPRNKAAIEYLHVNPKVIENISGDKIPSDAKLLAYYRPWVNAINSIPIYFKDDLANLEKNEFNINKFASIYTFATMLPGVYDCSYQLNKKIDNLGGDDEVKLSFIHKQLREYSSEYLLNHEKEVSEYLDNIAISKMISINDALVANSFISIVSNDNENWLQLFKEGFEKKPDLYKKVLNTNEHLKQMMAQINSLSDNGQTCMIADNDKAIKYEKEKGSYKTLSEIYKKFKPTNGIKMNFVASFDVDAKGKPHNITFEPQVEGKYFKGGDEDAQNNIVVMTEYINSSDFVPGFKNCHPYEVKGKQTFNFSE